VTGTPTLPVAGTDFVAQTGGAFTGDVSFGDNDKAIFGAGSDLQIYHDGSDSYIQDVGTGNLRIKAENLQVLGNADSEAQIETYQNDGVYLYFNGSQKLATTATGIDVTGTVFADEISTEYAGKIGFNTSDSFTLNGQDTPQYGMGRTSTNQPMGISGYYGLAFASSGTERMRIDSSGDVNIVNELKAGSYNETYAALSGTSPAVNCETGNSFSLVLSGNSTFTFTNPPASGTAYSFSIEIIQDSGASGYAVTWPSSVDWPAATAPTLTATASAKDIFVFTSRDGGTNWYGFTAGQALA